VPPAVVTVTFGVDDGNPPTNEKSALSVVEFETMTLASQHLRGLR